ncbi:MAG: hypothetical protein M1118_07530 [Chloroflexi bacterium]|nr:hypothetical protein [Chloroflexota bacterium]
MLPPLEALLPMHAARTAPPQLPAATTYRLLTTGRPELWDPVSGMTRPLPSRREGDQLVVQVPFTDWPAAFVVCQPEAAEEAVRLEGVSAHDTLHPARAA